MKYTSRNQKLKKREKKMENTIIEKIKCAADSVACGVVGKIRGSMTLEKGIKIISSTTGKTIIDYRLYCTRNSGTYGYQYRAVCWIDNYCVVGSKTKGYGYDKQHHAAETLFRTADIELADYNIETALKSLAEEIICSEKVFCVSFFG